MTDRPGLNLRHPEGVAAGGRLEGRTLLTLNRRQTLALGVGAGTALMMPRGAFAQEAPTPAGTEAHGMSAFGDLKYPADFPHFAYVEPTAPKGGTFSQIGPSGLFNQSLQTFNSLNGYILKGDAAQGIQKTFDTLMARALDEPDAIYGLVAKSVAISADGLTYRFRLRPEARFHDGSKLTAEDVAFTLNLLKTKGHPVIGQNLREMESAEAEGPEIVTVRFTPGRARCSWRRCRSSPRPITRRRISRRARWRPRSAPVPTRSGGSSRGISSNMRGGRTIGPPACR